MLDDLKYIHERDAQDALGVAEKQWQQLQHDFSLSLPKREYANVVYAGMGGSALAALFCPSWPGIKVPFEIVRQYNIPPYVSDKTLFIAASYSGNTEETLSAIAEAEAQSAQIVVIANGGKLQAIAQEKNYPLLVLPKVTQPRYGVLYNLKAIVAVLEAAALSNSKNALKELEDAALYLQQSCKDCLPEVPVSKNPAKKLALDIVGKSAVVYSGPLLTPVAYKWKINFNENAKQVAWWGTYPEFNHNEFIGWSGLPVDKPYAVIDLRSNLEHPRVQRRFEVSAKLLSGQRPEALVVNIQGDNLLQQLLWGVMYGDFVTMYVGLLNGVNPTPVELVEKFKKELQ